MNVADEPFEDDVVSIPLDESVFEKTFAAHSVVLIGTRDENGDYNLAPKHMATPLGWSNYFGFVCSPDHRTFQNIERTGEFTVSYPRPEQILSVSLSAEPRDADDHKPDLEQLETVRSTNVDADFIQESYIYLECHLETTSGQFGDNQFIAGEIIGQYVHRDVKRSPDRDDADIINENPVLCYLHPGRYAEIEDSQAFPFPDGFEK